jgi:ribonuclease Z
MRITFLGTSAAAPAVERGATAIFVEHEGTNILLDCGEGTARQMLSMVGGPRRLDALCISHEHPDHVCGVPGIFRQMALEQRSSVLQVFGTSETLARAQALVAAGGIRFEFPVKWEEVVPGQEWAVRNVLFKSFETSHRCQSIGFRLTVQEGKRKMNLARLEELGIAPGPIFGKFQRGESVTLENGQIVEPDEVLSPPKPGLSMAYTGDTRPHQGVVEAARGVDLLIHDATYLDDEVWLAMERAHSTASQAGEVAKAASVKSLFLTHISARYAPEEAEKFVSQAGTAFGGKITLASDGMVVDALDIVREQEPAPMLKNQESPERITGRETQADQRS